VPRHAFEFLELDAARARHYLPRNLALALHQSTFCPSQTSEPSLRLAGKVITIQDLFFDLFGVEPLAGATPGYQVKGRTTYQLVGVTRMSRLPD
jgi:hypothetical protein